jgi:hypothetical protein
MNKNDQTPFRVAKYFEEHIPRALEALKSDPEGMYQIVYRVGDLMVSAHVWREPVEPAAKPELTEADRQFLKECKVTVEDRSSDLVR